MIVMVGIPGSGKSHFAKQFSDFFSMPLVSAEKLKMFAAERATLYIIEEFLKSKQTFILDGESSSRKYRDALTILAQKNGYEVLFVWLQTESVTAKKRFIAKTRLPGAEFDKLVEKFVPPHQLGDVLVLSGKHTFPTQMKMVLGRLISSKSTHPIPVAPARKLDTSRK